MEAWAWAGRGEGVGLAWGSLAATTEIPEVQASEAPGLTAAAQRCCRTLIHLWAGKGQRLEERKKKATSIFIIIQDV